MSKLFKNDIENSKWVDLQFRDETTSDFSTQYNFSSGGVPSSLLITIDATHAGYINRNGFCYDSGAMSYAVSQDVWTKPFEKPLLKNHDMDVDPLGRVVASRFIKTSESEGFTQLDVKVTDKEAIQKIIDGRYLTVSTHGAPMDGAPNELKYVKCSICDQNMLTAEEWCGHMRGNIYDNEKTGNEQKCFWSIGAMDYKEVSIVNSPADYRSNEGAAQIVSYTMMDGENPVPFHEKEEAHRPALIFSDSEVAYADSSISEENFVEELIANPVLWEAVNHDKKAYIDSKGLLFVQDTEKDEEVGDEDTEDGSKAGLPSCSNDNENDVQLKGEKPTNPPVQKDIDLERYLSLVIRWDELSSEDKQEILVYTQWTLEKSLNDAKDARKREQDFDSVLKSLELIQ